VSDESGCSFVCVFFKHLDEDYFVLSLCRILYMFQKGKEKKTGSMGNERERGKRKVNPVEEIEDETNMGIKRKENRQKKKRQRKAFVGNL
jgi:hypothetical protein